MSMLSAQCDELRTLACELRQIKEHNTDWLHMEAVTLASSVDAILEAADTIEQLQAAMNKAAGNWARTDAKMKEHDGTRWFELFSTPERAAQTLADKCRDCCECVLLNSIGCSCVEQCIASNYDSLLEWLRGDA